MRIPNSSTGIPAGCFVFINKIDNLSQYTNERRNKLKTERAAHELGHGRGINGHIDHTTSDGTNWNKCCMKSVIYPEEVDNYYGPYFCGSHARTIRRIWW